MNDVQLLAVQNSAGELALRRIDALAVTGDLASAVYKSTSGDPAVFSDGIGAKLFREAEAEIVPRQSGSGDPAMSNVRPFVGYTLAVLTVSPTADPEDGTAYVVVFPSEAGTVYGGTVDFARGILTVDRGFRQFDGTETWLKGTTSGSNYFFCPIGELNSGVNDSGICSHFVAADIRGVTSDIGQRAVNSSGGDFRLCVRPENYESYTPSTFKSWVAEQAQNGTPLQIAWTLTEPVTYLFDPVRAASIGGTNYISADCGPVTVEYALDTGTAIDAGDADTRAMTAPDAPGYIAGRNYTAGEFLTVGAKLYRVTANIANGGTLTPGENVTETTVGEQLTALWAALNT